MAYAPSFVQSRFLADGMFDDINAEARRIIYLIVETGIRISEACAPNRDTIHLNGSIPYIEVSDENQETKTAHSIRQIPLVGVALMAMRAQPNGFPRYWDNPTHCSNTIWWDTELLPGDNFRQRIDEELAKAKAVVIIWTQTSAGSDWVIEEAEEARTGGKLTSVIGANTKIKIPKPFGVLHHVPIADRPSIPSAISKKIPAQPIHKNDFAVANEDKTFLATSAQRIQERARHLLSLTHHVKRDNQADHARELIVSSGFLSEALEVFLGALPLKGLRTFESRLWCKRLEDASQSTLGTIEKENWWLENKLTGPVISGAHNDLGFRAEQLLQATLPPEISAPQLA